MNTKITQAEFDHLEELRVEIMGTHFEYHCEMIEVEKRIRVSLASKSEKWRKGRSGDRVRTLLEHLENLSEEALDYPNTSLDCLIAANGTRSVTGVPHPGSSTEKPDPSRPGNAAQ